MADGAERRPRLERHAAALDGSFLRIWRSHITDLSGMYLCCHGSVRYCCHMSTAAAKRNDYLDSLPAEFAGTLSDKLAGGRRKAEAAHVSLYDTDYRDVAQDIARVQRDVIGTVRWIGY